jgi:hypothetical protein
MSAKILSIVAAAGLLIGSSAIVHAQTRGHHHGGLGTSSASPGHKMQSEGSRGGPGARGLALRQHGVRDDVDGYDSRTTGFGGRDSDDRLRNDRDDQMMDSDRSLIPH